MKSTDRALSFDNSIIELPYSITFASRHPLLAFATRQYQYSTTYQPELQYIKPLVLTVSHYSPNQLSDPLLRDADIRRAPLNSNGFRMHQEETLGSGYDADDSGDSPTLFSHALPEHFGPLASSVTSKRSTGLCESNRWIGYNTSSHTRNRSSTTVSDSGISILTDAPVVSSSAASTIRQRAPRVSKKDKLLRILEDLRKNKLSPLDLFAEVVDESCPEHDHYRQKMYEAHNRHKLENILDMIMDHARGRIVLLEWMRPYALQQVRETIYDEMDALTSEFHTMTSTITPEYLMSWNLKENVENVVDARTPCLLSIINTASQTRNSLEKNKKKDTTAVSPFPNSFAAYTTNISFPGKVRTHNATEQISI